MNRRELLVGSTVAGSLMASGRNLHAFDVNDKTTKTISQKLPIATYGATGGNRERLINLGFSLLHKPLDLDSIDNTVEELDYANERGAQVLVLIKKTDLRRIDDIGVAVASIREHPALYGWIVDEPEYGTNTDTPVPRETLRTLYDLVKSTCPWKPFGISPHWGEKPHWKWMEGYFTAFDFASLNSYPLTTDHVELAEDLHRPIARLIDSKIEYFDPCPEREFKYGPRFVNLWLTLQGANFGNRRIPTPKEFRFWLYAAATLGVAGFWVYKLDGDRGSRFIRELGDDVREFREFIDMFESPLGGYNYRMLHRFIRTNWNFAEAPETSWPEHHCFAALFRRDRSVYAVVVNGRQVERRYLVARVGSAFDGAALRPIGSTRNVEADVNGGVLRVGRDRDGQRVRPWEHFVFELT